VRSGVPTTTGHESGSNTPSSAERGPWSCHRQSLGRWLAPRRAVPEIVTSLCSSHLPRKRCVYMAHPTMAHDAYQAQRSSRPGVAPPRGPKSRPPACGEASRRSAASAGARATRAARARSPQARGGPSEARPGVPEGGVCEGAEGTGEAAGLWLRGSVMPGACPGASGRFAKTQASSRRAPAAAPGASSTSPASGPTTRRALWKRPRERRRSACRSLPRVLFRGGFDHAHHCLHLLSSSSGVSTSLEMNQGLV